MQFVKKHTKLAVSVAFCVVLVCFDLSPFGGSIHFYAKWIECGQKPVSLWSKPGLKWYESTKPVELVRFGYREYACTPVEAEHASYSASSTSWEFPHIK